MKACYIYYTIKIVRFILVECPKMAEIFGQILELVIRNCFKLVNRELEEKWERMNWKFRRIYATFILGTALQILARGPIVFRTVRLIYAAKHVQVFSMLISETAPLKQVGTLQFVSPALV